MAEKLIRLSALQRFKTKADAKYQDKLTAGSNINISGNTISAIAAPSNPTYTQIEFNPRYLINDSAIKLLSSVTLMPGIYFLVYTCYFSTTNVGGYRQCGFSTKETDITGFGRAWGDSRLGASYNIQTCVSGVFEVSASSYPNGQTFYFLARFSGGTIYASPNCSYVKLA